MKALISPVQTAQYISGWNLVEGDWQPVYTIVGLIIAQTAEESFDVAEPLYWVDCSPDVNAAYYYDPETKQCLLIPDEAPLPVLQQPVASGDIENA